MSTIDFFTINGIGLLPNSWIHGSNRKKGKIDPPLQIHKYNEHTIIFRESKDISFEAPFLYLLFGNEKAMLIDTGATKDEKKFPLRKTIDDLIAEWLTKNPRKNYSLVIIHTHGHNDHTTGDIQFSDRENTTIVQKDVESVQSFFNITTWPDDQTQYGLGGRILDILPTPGHDKREITIYDRWTKVLLTGDLIYPGRLYIFDFPAFLNSLDKLVAFSKDNDVKYLLGCHIEMTTTPFKDYVIKAKYQPHEPPLQMTIEQLNTIKEKARQLENKDGIYRYDDFILWIGYNNFQAMKQLLKSYFYNLRKKD